MGLTRAQYLSPPPLAADGSPVLVGQVQGVKVDLMSGIIILPDGTLRVAPEQVNGWVRTNNETAFNDYIWPTIGPTNYNGLIANANGDLTWWPVGQDNGPANPVIGTVYNVNVSGGTTGLVFTGGPVTREGTMTMSGILKVVNGGTGADNPSDARDNLGAGTVRLVQAGPGLRTNPAAGITVAGEVFVPDSGVVPGTYTLATITVDQRGFVTAASSPGVFFPPGTTMLFADPDAPPGWTREVGNDNSALRVVSAGGGTTGGSQPFTTSFAPYTPSGTLTITGTTSGGTTGPTQLTVDQMPVHNHPLNDPGHSHGVNDPGHSHRYTEWNLGRRDQGQDPAPTATNGGNSQTGGSTTGVSIQSNRTAITIGNAGGNQGHSHTLGSANINASGTFSGSQTSQFVVRYVNVILATKA